MNTITELLIYVLLGVFFYLYDINYHKYDNTCTDTTRKKITFNFNILFHHIISTSFFHFGWLSTNKNILLLYTIFGIIILIHWKIFGECIFNIHARNNCNGNYNFPLHQIYKSIIPEFIYPLFMPEVFLPISVIKLILLYKYNNPLLVNIIVISLVFLLYTYNYKKKQDDTGL